MLQIMKLFVMKFSPSSCYFLFLSSKYSAQHTFLKHSQPMFLLKGLGPRTLSAGYLMSS